MILKVAKLKNFGIFRNFSWRSGVPDFKKFNLIYGWNKSGKTTFSRVFSSCEKKKIEFEGYPKSGEFEVSISGGVNYKHSNCQDCAIQIKVFNKDFIEENVSFDPSNPSNPIVYVSEKDIDSTNKLKDLRAKTNLLQQKFDAAQKSQQKSEKAEDDFRKTLARNIKDTVGELKTNDKYRDYDKGSLRNTVQAVGIKNFTQLSDEDFEKFKKDLGVDKKPKQVELSKYEINIQIDLKNIVSFVDIYKEVKNILNKKVVAETIGRLKDDPVLNRWAQTGFELHKSKKEKQNCLFCQNSLDKDFLTSLSKHFSNDYEKLQLEIKMIIDHLNALGKNELKRENLDIYSNFKNEHKEKIKILNDIINNHNCWIKKAIEKLDKKYNNPLNTLEGLENPEDFNTQLNKVVERLNKIIKKHNLKVDNHAQELNVAKETLEQHLIAVTIKEQNYQIIKEDLDNDISLEKKARKELDENKQEISKLEKATSNIGKAIQKINKHLEEFFGRKELQLELDDEKKGYVIKRDGEKAYNLSEGEKNAIAFSYFIAKTQERGYKVKEGVIVIDDPISSFDSNFIYHCFSLIKNYFKDAGQLIILTHNFEFFNLIKYWFNQKNEKIIRQNEKNTNNSKKKAVQCEFLMIENIIENDKRCALIIELEETLKRFNSEYHFLFDRLNKFIEMNAPDYADFYTIGNIARRFLEIYANFKIPTTGDLKSKLDQLDTPSVTDTEKDKIYKLINVFSHGFDPTSTIEHKDKGEIQSAIRVILRTVQESDPKHYQSLKSNL